MKLTKKCENTSQIKNNISRRRSSAGKIRTSSLVSAVTSLILAAALSLGLGLVGMSDTYADTAINLTVDTDVLDLNILPTNASGSFAKSGNANILVSTNSPTGYELSIKASSSDANARNLVNGSNSNYTIRSFNSLDTPETAVTEANFKALANTKYNGMWGFLPSKYNSADNADFIAAPDVDGVLIDSTNTDNESTANQYTLAIGARVDSSTKLGLYSNTYVITAVANGTPYSFIYNDNVVSNMPNDKISMTSAASENLASNIPTRDGYEFIGWCLGTSSASNITTIGKIDTCSSTTYQPGASITVTSGTTNDKYLYAMWRNTSKTSIDDLTYMQDFASLTSTELAQVKTSMTTNTSYQLTDSRDGTKYWITKLQTASSNPRATDGYQIWMTQNLDLDLSTSKILNSTDTDLVSCTSGIYSAGYTLNSGICYWTPGESTSTSMSSTTSTTTPQSYNPGNVYYYQNQSASTTCTTANECLHWHIGNYYNWSAAVASNNSSSQTANYAYAGNSICPAGWRIPTSLTSASGYSDFNYLLVQQGIAVNYVGAGANATWATNGYSNIQGAPLYIVRSGYNNGSSLSDAAAGGHLWSGSSVSSTHAYNLYYDSGGVGPAGDYGDRYTRLPVRCLVRE